MIKGTYGPTTTTRTKGASSVTTAESLSRNKSKRSTIKSNKGKPTKLGKMIKAMYGREVCFMYF